MSDHPTPLGGTCSARFEPVRGLFAAKLESGEDLGASVAVNIVGYSLIPGGRVRAWGGTGGSMVIIDVDRRITLAYVMSKMAPAAVIAPALAERLSQIVKG